MRKTFTIINRGVISRITAFLEAQPLEPLLEVVIKTHQQDRSLAQNSLYWQWITIIGEEWGWTKEDVHNHFKYRILCRIYERDEPGYSQMISSVRKLRKMGLFNEHKILVKNIIGMTSTTGATVKQFTEYLNDIEKDMVSKGISLPHPEDRYYQAMGIKTNE